MENEVRIDLVNRLYSCFLQAMEYHPLAGSSVGIGVNHSHMENEIELSETWTDLDRKQAEDLVIMAIECLYEVKLYDYQVFNPINFQIITMCEYALPYYPESIPIYNWLLKIYAKLGLVSLVTDLSERFPLMQGT